jgi:hypothetical protein
MSRSLRLLLFGMVAASALAASWLFLQQPRGLVTIGSRFADGTPDGARLRPGQPLRALLSLGSPLGKSGHVDVELHHLVGGADHLEKLLPTRAGGRNDELMIAFADVVQLVGPLRGDFRLVFVRDGRVLGEGRFAVEP